MTVDEITNSEHEMRTPSDQKVLFASDEISLWLHSNCMTHHKAYCCEGEIIGSLSGFNWFRTFSWEALVAIVLNL